MGYGGTKTEMQRLISDAAMLSDTVDAQSMSFANIVEAIHVVQTEMGITGTTALEAGQTISGSVGAMKAAWSNLVTGIADNNANFGALIDNFVTTIVGDGTENNLGVFGNLLPRIEVALDGAVKLIEGIFPKIIEILPGLIESLLPSLVDGALNIVETFANSISKNADMIIESASKAIMTFINGISKMLPNIVSIGLDVLTSFIEGITKLIPELVPVAIQVIKELSGTLTKPSTLSQIVNAAIDIMEELVYGLIDAIPQLVDSAVQIIENLVVFLTDKDTLMNLLDAAVQIVFSLVEAIINNLDPLLDAAIEAIIAFVEFLLDPKVLGKLARAALEIIIALAGGLVSYVGKLVDAAIELGAKLGESLVNMDWQQIGKDLVSFIFDGITSAWETVKGWISDAWESIKNLFKGASDATKTAEEAVSYSKEQLDAANNALNEYRNSTLPPEDRIPSENAPIDRSKEDEAWSKNTEIVQNIYTYGMTPGEAMEEARYQQELIAVG